MQLPATDKALTLNMDSFAEQSAPLPPAEAYVHGAEHLPALRAKLASVLPESLRVLRRLQFPPASRDIVALASFPPEATFDPRAARELYAVGVYDPESIPGGQASVFSSIELETSQTDTRQREALAQVVRIIDGFRARKASLSRHIPTRPENAPESPEDGEDIILLGSVHSLVARLLRQYSFWMCDNRLVRDDIGGKGGPYQKWVFRSSGTASEEELALPDDVEIDGRKVSLAYDEVSATDFALVAANNAIVRDPKNLYRLPGYGIREAHAGKLVAWAFFGVEGCVRTVHVEPPFRRRGLARKVVSALLNKKMQVYGGEVAEREDDRKQDGTVDWAHADIAAGNESSIRLFQSLDAKYSCDVFWIRVDLSKVSPPPS